MFELCALAYYEALVIAATQHNVPFFWSVLSINLNTMYHSLCVKVACVVYWHVFNKDVKMRYYESYTSVCDISIDEKALLPGTNNVQL